jgi:hypothetical protein
MLVLLPQFGVHVSLPVQAKELSTAR